MFGYFFLISAHFLVNLWYLHKYISSNKVFFFVVSISCLKCNSVECPIQPERKRNKNKITSRNLSILVSHDILTLKKKVVLGYYSYHD